MASLKPLIMRANRLLGANLVERNLVSIDDLDAANERLLELLSKGGGKANRQASLLTILTSEKQTLSENALMEHLVEEEGLGIIDVRNVEIPPEINDVTRFDECWATWTIPFDQVEETRYLASAYYLSPVVRKYWEDKFSGKLVWYASSLEAIMDFLEIREAEKAKAEKAAAK